MIQSHEFFEDVEVRGHIIDSLILPKILDVITSSGSQFLIRDMNATAVVAAETTLQCSVKRALKASSACCARQPQMGRQ